MAGSGGSHPCPGHVAAVAVPDEQLACRRHWFELPAPLRREIGRTWRSGGGEAHRRAITEAARVLRRLGSG